MATFGELLQLLPDLSSSACPDHRLRRYNSGHTRSDSQGSLSTGVKGELSGFLEASSSHGHQLNDRILNNDLLRLLAKMQTDTEPSIRTNTCILIGRLAPMLGPNTKKKVLVPAFARSLKDPFVHARVAGLMALMATVEVFDRDDLAGKVVPNMAFTLVDKEK